MRIGIIVSIFILFLSTAAHGTYLESYRGLGYDQTGEPVVGIIYTNDQPLEVTGKITDSQGNTRDFVGRWNGLGVVTGETEDGVMVDLITN